jgi:hypothetical protein
LEACFLGVEAGELADSLEGGEQGLGEVVAGPVELEGVAGFLPGEGDPFVGEGEPERAVGGLEGLVGELVGAGRVAAGFEVFGQDVELAGEQAERLQRDRPLP